MPDADWQPIDQPPKSPFIRKLGTYLFGVAIGFVILGWFQYRKSVAAQQQRQQLQDQAVTPSAGADDSNGRSP
ncbi:MAG: hypothetical protein AAGA55_07405 [Planctomycetota bacterium]